MDFDMKKETLSSLKEFGRTSAKKDIDIETNLPDYCSDIKRILKCSVTPGITSVKQTGERITASGTAMVRTIYAGEGDKTDCFEQTVDLSLFGEMKNIPEDAVILCKADTQYVNCRANSQRRFTVTANINVTFIVLANETDNILSKADGCSIETKNEKIKCDNVIDSTEKNFDMGETVELPESYAPIGKILHCSSNAVLDSIKAVSGKILLKGDFITEILYLSDDGDGRAEKYVHTMPISQIVELSDTDADTQYIVRLFVASLMVSKKNDSSGSPRLFEIEGRVCAFIKAFNEKETEIITDCYSTDFEVKSDYNISEFKSRVYSVDRQKTVKTTLDMTGQNIGKITDLWFGSVSGIFSCDGESIMSKCSAVVCALYSDENNSPVYAEKNIDFDFEEKLKEIYSFPQCDGEIIGKRIDFSKVGNDKIEVKAEFGIVADIYSAQQRRICNSIDVDENKKKEQKKSALTIYYCDGGEKVWDIAKKYNTTCKAIMEENKLTDENINGEKMIMIPCC